MKELIAEFIELLDMYSRTWREKNVNLCDRIHELGEELARYIQMRPRGDSTAVFTVLEDVECNRPLPQRLLPLLGRRAPLWLLLKIRLKQLIIELEQSDEPIVIEASAVPQVSEDDVLVLITIRQIAGPGTDTLSVLRRGHVDILGPAHPRKGDRGANQWPISHVRKCYPDAVINPPEQT
jgi:hypothetical protein